MSSKSLANNIKLDKKTPEVLNLNSLLIASPRLEFGTLTAVLDHINEGVLVYDNKWNYLYINPQASEILGPKVNRIGRNVLEFAPDFKKHPFYKIALKAKKERSEIRYEIYHEPLRKWFKNRVIPRKDMLLVFFEDITEQKILEDKNKQFLERLRLAQEAGKIGSFEWDLKTDRVYWSPEQEGIYGLKAGSFSGTYKDVEKRILPEDIYVVRKSIKKAIKEKKDFEVDFRIIHEDKSTRWVRGKGRAYFDKKSKPEKFIGINYDITETKRLEDWLNFKSEANKILTSSLNYQKTLDSIAKMAVPKFADWCSVDLLENGEVTQVSVVHKDPKKVKWAKRLRQQSPVNLNEPNGLPKVLREGKSEFVPFLSEELLRQANPNERTLRLIKKIGLTSIIIVPLKTKGEIFGAITFVSAESKSHYNEADLRLAEQLASRASYAIENARLYGSVQEEKERLNSLIENVPGVVWEAYGKPNDKKQRINFVNKHVETMLGYSVEDWLKTPNFWLKIVHPEDKKRAANEAGKIFKTGGGGVSRFRWLTKLNNPIWVEAHSYVIKDEKGKPVGMGGVTMDISDRMELEKRKDEFISIASHELKTPITSLKVYLQLEEKKVLQQSDSDTSNLAKMHRQVDKITEIISDLLNLSKIQAGKIDYKMEKLDLALLIEEVLESFSHTYPDYQFLKKEIVAAEVFGARDKLAQVLTNILNNAVKFSPNKKKVIISMKKVGSEVVVIIKDYGIGIDKVNQNKIFDRFYQISTTQRQSRSGLGMGLYISADITKRHDGRLWVDSRVGKGSTFYLALPLNYEKTS